MTSARATGGAHPTSAVVPDEGRLTFLIFALAVALHVLIGPILVLSPGLAKVHANLAVVIGLTAAFVGPTRYAAYGAAYVAGSEILWRAAGADVYWELGKYAVVLILGVGLFRLKGRLRSAMIPILYFVLLLPSILVAPYDLLSSEARGALSFTLSGPLALAISVLFFRQLMVTRGQMLILFLFSVTPIVAGASNAAWSTLTAGELAFVQESSFVASGGYGPNQVSAVLGLGAILLILAGAILTEHRRMRLLLAGLAMALATQCALTLSRGGLYGAIGALMVAGLFLLRTPRVRVTFLAGSATIITILALFIFPRLDAFTGGMMSQRFSDTNPGGRIEVFYDELRIFSEHPVFGVGPGAVRSYRGPQFRRAPLSHTEYTRAMAEHGVLGLAAVGAMLGMGLGAIRCAGSYRAMGAAAAMVVWALLTMSHASLRLAAPGFVFGMAATFRASIASLFPQGPAIRRRF